jgi:hypothetical protein
MHTMLTRLTILLILFLACTRAQSQLVTVYVDATNGSDSFSGANPTDSPSGTGPKATIHAGLSALANNGRLILYAGTYAGDGVDSDGSPANNTDNADINISTSRYPRLITGLTLELRSLAANNEIKIFVDPSSVRSANGALINHSIDQYIPNFIFNIPNGVLSITTTSGNEYLSLAAAHSSGIPVSGLFLAAGNVDIEKGSFFRLHNGATITMTGSSRFLREAPQKENDLNLTYVGNGAYTAGSESGYASFGSGVLTINREAGSAIIFPFSMTFTGNNDALLIQSGSVAFNSALMLGAVGSGSQSARTADLVISTSGVVVFNAPVNLVVASSLVADSSISGIDVTSNATVSFQQPVTWMAAHNSSDVSFPATEATALVWNSTGGAITFGAGAVFTHAYTTANNGPATVEARIQNNGTGKISFRGPISVVPRTETSASAPQQFSIGAINNGGGTLEISGILRSGLVNTATLSTGTINIIGPTTLGALGSTTGSLVSMPRTTLNLGSNTLTLLGNVGHTVVGSSVVSTTGSFLVKATGTVTFDGGSFPSLSIDQQAGETRFPAGGTLSSLSIISGTFSSQSAVTATGPIMVNGGTLVFQSSAALNSLSVVSGSCSIQSGITATGRVAVSGGTLTLQGSATLASFEITSGSCSFLSNATIAGLLSLNGGTFLLADSTNRSLTVGEYRQSGGVFNLGGSSGGDLRLQGSFTLSGGSILQGSSANLIMIGSGVQSFDSGSPLQLQSINIENTGGGVRLARSLRLSSSLFIGTGAKLDLGLNNIVLNGDGAVFTNNGSYTCAGYGVIMGGATIAQGGANIVGSEIHAGIGSSFSSFAVDVGNANTCSIKGLAQIGWSNTLGVYTGALDVASAVDLRPSGASALVVRDVSYASRVTTSVGTFNAARVIHTVRCIGNLLIDYTMAPNLLAELESTDSLIVDVNSDAADGDGNLATGQLRYFQFPGNGFVYGGTLVVGPTAALQLEANGKAGDSLELSGTNVRHSVRGILKTAESGDRILISGSTVSLVGSTNPTDISLVGNTAISSQTLCTIIGVQGFTGSLMMLAGSSATVSMGTTPAKQRIQGALSLNGVGFSLAGDLEVMGGATFNAGTLNFGSYNLQLSTSGDFLQNSTAAGYSTSGGSLIMNRAGAQLRIGNSAASGLPSLQILSNTTLAAPGWVTRNLTIGSNDLEDLPSLTLGKAGNDLIFAGSTISLLSSAPVNKKAIIADGTTNGTPGGRLFVAGSSVLMIINGDYSIEELLFNPPSADGTLSVLSADQTPHVLTISDILTHAGGQIGIGLNHLALTGTGTIAGQRAYNRSDGTIGASSGEFRFVGAAPQQFICGTGFTIPNLRIWNPKGVIKPTGSPSMIVTESLDLSDGTLAYDGGSITLENGATLIRRRTTAALSNPISYHGSINVSYIVDRDNGNLKTDFELPAEAGALSTLKISIASTTQDSSSVLLDRNITVSGTLLLDSGQLDIGSSSLTLAPGGLIDVNKGRIKAAGAGSIKVSTYGLTYRSSVVVGTTNQEFQSGSGITVSRLSILGTSSQPTIISLTVNRSIGALSLNAPRGGIEFGPAGSFVARNLTVKDGLAVVAGGFTNTTGTAALINLSGSSRQIVTIDSTGLSLQGGGSPIHLQLNNPAGFDLRGGDLVFSPGSLLLFANGVLNSGGNAVVLSHSATGQGFDRQGVIGKNVSHIAGLVRQGVPGGAGNMNEHPNGRYEFPTGTLTEYRPLAITFTNAYPALGPGTIEVTHVAGSPDGSVGLPLSDSSGNVVRSYPNFYWRINASKGSFGSGQNYDLEASVGNPAFGFAKAGDLRFICRSDLSPATSAWSLLGSAAGYTSSSLTSAFPGDTTLTVRVISAGKGIEGSNLLTLGLQSRPLVFVSREPLTALFIRLNVQVTFKVTAFDRDKQPLTYTWKLDGKVVKQGSDSTFTTVFLSYPKILTAVFSNPAGMSDSTNWTSFGPGDYVEGGGVPQEFGIGQNYPNPFNPSTNIELKIPRRDFVQVKVFNVLGVEVATLVNEIRDPGVYIIRWNASSFPSGIYLYQMKAGAFLETRKMVLLK